MLIQYINGPGMRLFLHLRCVESWHQEGKERKGATSQTLTLKYLWARWRSEKTNLAIMVATAAGSPINKKMQGNNLKTKAYP